VAASHEAGALTCTFDATASAEIDEAKAALRESSMAAHGVAPVRVARVDEDVAPLQIAREIVQHGVNGRPGGNIDEDGARRRQLGTELVGSLNENEACVAELRRRVVTLIAHDADALFQGMKGEVSAHPAETDEAEL